MQRPFAGAAPLMELVERDGQLARIEQALARAREGGGGAVMVGGPAGIGKTAMLAAVRAAATDAGMLVLRSRGAELEREFGFGIVRQLFEPLLAAAAAEERTAWLEGPAGLAARLLDFPGARSGDPDAVAESPDPSFAVLHGLYWLCANLATTRPVCLLVDDAHWADAASLRFLAFLKPRLEELPATLVVATRPGEGASAGGVVYDLAADAGTEHVEPAPLSPAAVAVLLERAVATTPDPEFVDACHRATGGVPFLVGQLVRAIRDDGISPVAAAVPRIDELGAPWAARWILVRLGRLPPEAAKLARALAVLESSDIAHVAPICGLDAETAARAAAALVAAGVVAQDRPLRFVHPVVRRGIYDEIGFVERARAHRHAAQVLAAAGAPRERVVEHLLASDPAGDPWVLDQLREAGRTAVARGAPEAAITYLRRALEEPPGADEQSALLIELGRAELSAGDEAALDDLRRAVELAPDDAGFVQAGLVLTNAYGVSQRFDDALLVLDRIAARLGGDGDLSGMLETAAIGVAMLEVGTAVASRDRIQAARARADQDAAVDRDALALAAVIAGQSNEPVDTVAALAERAWAAGGERLPETDDLPWFEQLTASLTWAERGDLVLPKLDAAIERARTTASTRMFASALAYRGVVALQRGDLQAAEVDPRTALESPGIRPPQLYRTLLSAVLIEILVERGELDEAERLLGALAGEAERRHSVAAWLRLSRGRLRIAQRRVEEGLADAVAAGDIASAMGFDAPGWLPWRPVAALAALRLGDLGAARMHATAGLDLARASAAPRALGVALSAAGVVLGGAQGEELLHESLTLDASCGARLEHARSLAELGAQLRRSNRRAEAREMLREALDVATRLGARPLADHAETELRATGARPRRVVLTGVEALTASERRVAELAAQGLANREIAQTLFVTARTVEGHLTGAFRKLDVSSRTELAAALAGVAD